MSRRLCSLLACLAIPAGPVYSAEQVVLESNAARYAAGSIVDAASRIVLERGEFVLIATEDARFVRIEGPHDGPAAGPTPDENDLRKALTVLVGTDRSQIQGVGGVRAAGGAIAGADDGRPDPWLVHAQRSGDQCALRGERELTLWRETAGDGETWEIGFAGNERAGTFVWPASALVAPWPATLVPQDGGVYSLRAATALRPVTITLRMLEPSVAEYSLAAAAWLAAKGCMAQARLVLR